MDKPTSTCATLCSKRTHDRPSTCAAHAHRARRGSLREYGRASRGGGSSREGWQGWQDDLCLAPLLLLLLAFLLFPFPFPLLLLPLPTSQPCTCTTHAHTQSLSLPPPFSLFLSATMGAAAGGKRGESQWQELSMIACAQRAWAAGGQPPQVCSSYCRSAPTAGLLLRY